jgi:hypothetical protein
VNGCSHNSLFLHILRSDRPVPTCPNTILTYIRPVTVVSSNRHSQAIVALPQGVQPVCNDARDAGFPQDKTLDRMDCYRLSCFFPIGRQARRGCCRVSELKVRRKS